MQSHGTSKLIAGTTLSVLVLAASPADAGGLYLNEFMTTAQGAAGAGAGALAEDASTVLHNPAGMTRVKGQNLAAGAGVVTGVVKFEPSENTPFAGGDGGQQSAPAPILSGFYTHQLSERWTAGAGLYSVSGAALNPDDDWAGRFQLTDITLLTLQGGGSIAYKVTDWLSLGGTAAGVFGTLDYDLRTPPLGPGGREGRVNLDGNDLTFAWSAGALLELSEQTRVGVTYFSGFEVEFDGELTAEGLGQSVDTRTSFDFAPQVRVSGYHEVNDWLTLLGTLGWDGWSSFDDLVVAGSERTVAINRDWRDTWHLSGGARFQVTPELMLQGGITYDTSPTSADTRTADTPIDNQLRLGVGGLYDLSETLAVGASFVYADYGEGPISNATLDGKYSQNDLFFVGLNVVKSF